MTIITAGGSFAENYTSQFDSEITSIRDLDEPAFLEKLTRATTIIHNAATVESTDLELSTARNFDFTRYLVQKIHKLNPDSHLILLSSMSILDPENSEAYGDVLAMTPYAYSKYLAETFCLKSELRHFSCVRFSTLFFQDPKKDGLSKLVNDAATVGEITVFNNGEAKRNFLPLRIASQYVEKIAAQTDDGKQAYTLASPEATSYREVATILEKLIPGLTVIDKTLSTGGNAVLSKFSTDSIKKLGQIDFSLEDEIAAYVRVLQS